MSTLSVKVLAPNQYKTGEFKEVFRQTLTVEDSLEVPYNSLVGALKYLFPFKDVVVQFNIH